MFLKRIISRHPRMAMTKRETTQPIPTPETKGVDVKPVTTEQFLERIAVKRKNDMPEPPKKPAHKKEVEPLNIKEKNY